MSLKTFTDALPDYAKDLRLNMGSLLSDQTLPRGRPSRRRGQAHAPPRP